MVTKDLPNLLPEDPALAAVIAEEMAKAYGEAFTQGSGAQPPVVVPNKEDQARGKSGPKTNSGSFVKEGGGGEKKSRTQRRGKAPPETWSPQKIEAMNRSVSATTSSILSGNRETQPCPLGVIPTTTTDVITSGAGLDVRGYRASIARDGVLHAYNSHGEQHTDKLGHMLGEQREDQIPLTQKDYDRIGDTLSGCQSAKLGSSRQTPVIQVSKTYEDGTLTTAWAVSARRKALTLIDMWKHP